MVNSHRCESNEPGQEPIKLVDDRWDCFPKLTQLHSFPQDATQSLLINPYPVTADFKEFSTYSAKQVLNFPATTAGEIIMLVRYSFLVSLCDARSGATSQCYLDASSHITLAMWFACRLEE